MSCAFFAVCDIGQNSRVGAILREQNALPYEAWTTANPLAKNDVNNVGAGRAAKGAIPGRSFLAIPSLRSLRPHQNEAIMQKMHKCLIFLHFWINIQSKKPSKHVFRTLWGQFLPFPPLFSRLLRFYLIFYT